MRPLRRAIAGEVHKLVRSRASSGFDPLAPRTDHGFFGPDSVAWRVHGDFTTMMVGGVSALLLQMLHPAALAGVWDHSDFRRDMAGRLQRTATFLGGTTYGSTQQALALIARVRSIHDRVNGTLPDGRPYSANDPELLTWVHIAGTWSFLQAYMRFGGTVSAVERDRYFEETALIARMLGGTDLPITFSQVEQYVSDMRPSLQSDLRTRTVARALLNQPAPSRPLEPFRKLVMSGGIDLLPAWARRMHELQASPRLATGVAVKTVQRVTAWALAR